MPDRYDEIAREWLDEQAAHPATPIIVLSPLPPGPGDFTDDGTRRARAINDGVHRLAALLRTTAAEEREACADVADQHASIEGIAQSIAAAIRARGGTG